MKKVDLSLYNNDWYKPGNVVKRTIWFLIHIILFRNPLLPLSSLKSGLLRLFGANIGKGVVIKPGVSVKYPWFLEIGDYTWVGENVWIDNLAKIKIGKNCCLSQGAMLLTGNHNYKNTTFDLITSPIELEDGCWVGAQSVVCPGVTMHSHSILTVLSVLAENTKPYGLYRGNPAEWVRERVID